MPLYPLDVAITSVGCDLTTILTARASSAAVLIPNTAFHWCTSGRRIPPTTSLAATTNTGSGRISWLKGGCAQKTRWTAGIFLCGIKSSEERNGVLGLVCFRAVRPSNSTHSIHHMAFALRGWSCGHVSVYLSKAGMRFCCLFV